MKNNEWRRVVARAMGYLEDNNPVRAFQTLNEAYVNDLTNKEKNEEDI